MENERESITIRKGHEVWLRLPGKSYKPNRHIGDFVGWNVGTGTAREFRARRSSDEVYRGNNGIGICYRLLKDWIFDLVVVFLPGRTLRTTRRHFLARGQFKWYKRNGLEKQLFLPLEEFGLDKAREMEKQSDAEEAERRRRKTAQSYLIIPRTVTRTLTAMARIVAR